MNRQQKYALAVAAMVLMAFVLFPPWVARERRPQDRDLDRGRAERRHGPLHQMVFAPPPRPTDTRADGSALFGPYRLDALRGLAILSVLASAGMCVVLALSSRRMRLFDVVVLLLMGVAGAFLTASLLALTWGIVHLFLQAV